VSPRGLRARARALHALRTWFADHGYLEVPTPVVVPSPAMEEHLYAQQAGDGFLRTSPEFALKKVLAAGLPRIYEIGPCYRGREHGPWHSSEFTMVEWYRARAGLSDLIDEVQRLVGAVAEALDVPTPGPWRVTTVRRIFQEHTGMDLAKADTRTLSPIDESWDDAFFRRWVAEVEPNLCGALIVRDWPASQAALATVRSDGPWPVAERFEVYLNGIELANAFQELIDSAEQRRRFAASAALRVASNETPHPLDEALVAAVGRMPRTAGIALGLDRLVAALMGWDGIADGQVPVG